MSAQQIQSIKILQMNCLELTAYIEDIHLDNPVLDLEYPFDKDIHEPPAVNKWQEMDRQNIHYIRADSDNDWDQFSGVSVPFMQESLLSHVDMQLDALHLHTSLRKAASFIAANLDENGYLQLSISEIADSLKITRNLAEHAVTLIRSLDPPGIGASDLRCCLLLQLERTGLGNTAISCVIVRDFLEMASKNQFNAISKALCVPEADVRSAVNKIKALDPKPGLAFYRGETTSYVLPDITVQITDASEQHLIVQLNEHDLPVLHINSYYKQLMSDSGDIEVKEYISTKIRQIKWLINCIEQRRTTLKKCAIAIFKAQIDFFNGSAAAPVPLKMSFIADIVGVNVSTVSRAIKGKYLQCDRGVFPLLHFFPKGFGDACVERVKSKLRDVIEFENKAVPLSDQKIVESLKAHDISVSRRTVAKYRDEMLIPNATGRKML